MKQDFNLSIEDAVREYRRAFLKRKNIQGYKKLNKYTPKRLDKLVNAFDRKIKKKPIFSEKVKEQYFLGLEKIFTQYYETLNQNRLSKKDAYINYLATNFKISGRGRSLKNNLNKLMTYSEFIKSGLCNSYR